jgi:hypothetical protein
LLLLAMLPMPFALGGATLGDGSFLGLSDTLWLLIAVAVPVVHQWLVAVVWRTQLAWRVMTRVFGRNDLAVWTAVFMPLLVCRPLAVLGLGIADAGSLGMPLLLAVLLSIGLGVPAVYTMGSIGRYFGVLRAVGGDHFREHYRALPLIRAGAFEWSDNAMYTFAFMGLWAIAFATQSWAALTVCLFQHAYIWVHFFVTEQPDMELLYE